MTCHPVGVHPIETNVVAPEQMACDWNLAPTLLCCYMSSDEHVGLLTCCSVKRGLHICQLERHRRIDGSEKLGRLSVDKQPLELARRLVSGPKWMKGVHVASL